MKTFWFCVAGDRMKLLWLLLLAQAHARAPIAVSDGPMADRPQPAALQKVGVQHGVSVHAAGRCWNRRCRDSERHAPLPPGRRGERGPLPAPPIDPLGPSYTANRAPAVTDFMRRLPIAAVVDEKILGQLQRHPSFANFSLVHTDMGQRRPVLLRSGVHGRRPRPAWVFNPAVHDGESTLLKVGTFSKCAIGTGAAKRHSGLATHVLSDGSTTVSERWAVWLRHEQVAGVYRFAEDPRPVMLRGRMHMIFTRKVKPKKRGFGSRLFLAALEPTYREVLLNYSGSRFIEKNWMPWVHEGQLYISYSLCPHRVLRCDDRDGRCVLVATTRIPSCDKRLRGSSQWVAVDGGSLVGVAHVTRTMGGSERATRNVSIDLRYEHVFVQAAAEPPFELRFVSPAFTFPRLYGTDVDYVQFCAGLAVNGRWAELSLGVGDCGAISVSMPTRELLRFANVTSQAAPEELTHT
jgi:hypothetical protein